MKFTAAATACLVSCAIANPIGETIILARNAPFTDPSCALSQSVSGTPLTFLFPSAVEIGTILGPLLKAQIGEDNVEKLDNIADALCVNSQEESSKDRGICAEALQAIKDIVNAAVPATKAAKYRCLLNLLCIANSGVPVDGTCQALLRGADCVANRIIQAEDLECTA